MMKIYRAATPEGGSNLNVLKFSQVVLENGLTLRKPSTHISPHLPYISPISPDISHINVLELPQAPLLPSSRQVMLENGFSLKGRPPTESFDEQGQLKGTKGGSADAAAAAMVAQGGGARGKRGWARLGAAARGGRSLGRMTLMMNLGTLMR